MSNVFIPLPSALDLQSPALVAFVGGGGKTSLMLALASALPGGVVVTTTTRIFAVQMKMAAAVCYEGDLSELGPKLTRHNSCLVVGKVEGDKALGVDRQLPSKLLSRPDVEYVLVEADGSRMRPIKAPAEHEPVVPDLVTHLVPVVGIDALDNDIQQIAHRPELVVRLLAGGRRRPQTSDRLSTSDIAELLTHAEGGLKDVPDGTRVIPFINKVETDGQLLAARQVARLVLREDRIERVVVGAVKSDRPVREVHTRVTAVVLAAGQSQRMGRTKQLLTWRGTTILGQTLQNLKRSAAHDILVISGHQAESVESIAASEGVSSIRNPQYATGEMLSSLKAAVKQLPGKVSAVLVALADQPMVEPEIVDRLLQAFWQGRGQLIAPVYEGQRGNPVLIGRLFFDELLGLPPEAAPKALLKRHEDELFLLPVETDSVLRDLDHLDDYRRWRP
jgi:molybdenum cofactor cytidylyltransferase